MNSTLIAVSIMAHPERQHQAERLATLLATEFPTRVVYDPEPNGAPGTIRTARLAWRPWHPKETHHLLLQEDAIPRSDLAKNLRLIIKAHPDRWITLATEWGSRTSWVCRAAAFGARPFGPVVDSYVPAWGLLMPASNAAALAEWLLDIDEHEEDDHALNDFVRANQVRAPLICVPNLIDHGDLNSMLGHDTKLGHRRSALTSPHDIPTGWWDRPVLEDVAGLPFLSYWQPTYPRELVAPGHDGYDYLSLKFNQHDLSAVEKAWQLAGVDLHGLPARALSNLTLTIRALRAYSMKSSPFNDGPDSML